MTVRNGSVLALDLGGTRLKAGCVDPATGTVAGFTSAATEGRDADGALAVIRRVGSDLAEQATGTQVGLAVPGVVDDGTITALPGKFDGIVGIDLSAWLKEVFGRSALVVNDAIAYGAGEARFGAGADAVRVVVVTIGTGIGVSVYEHGVPLGSGARGGGTLGGHIPISEATGPVDTNGRQGTIEARCNAAAIVHYARETGLDVSDVPDVYEAVRAGDPAAVSAINTYRTWLVRGLVALAHAHGPDTIVLGGGPMTSDNPVIVGLEDAVNDRLWPGYLVRIRTAVLGDHASLAGVAHLCLQGPSL